MKVAANCRAAVAVISVFCGGLLPVCAGAQTSSTPALPRVTATLAGKVTTLSSWAHDHCPNSDSPDTPPRAFRDAAGLMHLFVVGNQAYPLIGPDFFHLHKDCRSALGSLGSKDPAAYADQWWLTSTYTKDGQTVQAIVHDEFHGVRQLGQCNSSDPGAFKCTYVAQLAATSSNGGKTFTVLPRPAGLIAASPYRYEPDIFAGYMNPSNIVTFGGYYYVTVGAVRFRGQEGGNCLLRTATLNNPASWRAWDGTGFNVALTGAYFHPDIVPEQHLCKPVSAAVGQIQGATLVQHVPDGLFIMIGFQATGTRHSVPWFRAPVVSTSSDLINWSPAQYLLNAADEEKVGDTPYAALIDPASTDRNFMSVGDRPVLIWVHTNNGASPDRDINYVPIRLSESPPPR